MTFEPVKNLIIGSGEGGKVLAWHLAEAEQTVVVERRWVGGSCPNVNCLPSKNEIWMRKSPTSIRHASRFGTSVGPVSIDMATVREMQRRDGRWLDQDSSRPLQSHRRRTDYGER